MAEAGDVAEEVTGAEEAWVAEAGAAEAGATEVLSVEAGATGAGATDALSVEAGVVGGVMVTGAVAHTVIGGATAGAVFPFMATDTARRS